MTPADLIKRKTELREMFKTHPQREYLAGLTDLDLDWWIRQEEKIERIRRVAPGPEASVMEFETFLDGVRRRLNIYPRDLEVIDL